MEQKYLYDELQSIFDNVFLDKVELSPSLSAKEVEEWDSLIHISLVVAIEKHFKIRFQTGEVEGTKNIGDFVNLIEKKLKSKG